jgi:hypothetical protein
MREARRGEVSCPFFLNSGGKLDGKYLRVVVDKSEAIAIASFGENPKSIGTRACSH